MRSPARHLAALGAVVAVLTALAPAAHGGTAPTGATTPAPEVLAIVDDASGDAATIVIAIHRDPQQRRRWTLVLDESIDLERWVLTLTTRGWPGGAQRITVRTADDVPTALLSDLSPDGAVPVGTIASALVEGAIEVDLPSAPDEDSFLTLTAKDPDGGRSFVAPVLAAELLDVANDGLRSPTVGQGRGPGTSSFMAVAPGPSITRTGDGIRITVAEDPPTAVGELEVASVLDEVLLRVTDDASAPVLARLVVGTDEITALAADDEPVVAAGTPWSVPLELDPEIDLPIATVTFDDLGLLAGEPVDGAARFGVVRTIDLADGGSIVADGLDVVHAALPIARQLTTDDEVASAAEADLGGVLVLVAVGVLIVAVITVPAVRHRRMARRARRERRAR